MYISMSIDLFLTILIRHSCMIFSVSIFCL